MKAIQMVWLDWGANSLIQTETYEDMKAWAKPFRARPAINNQYSFVLRKTTEPIKLLNWQSIITCLASNRIITGAKKTVRTPQTNGVTLLRMATSFSVISKSFCIDRTAAGIDPPSTLMKKTEQRKVNKMKRLADKGTSFRSLASLSSTEV